MDYVTISKFNFEGDAMGQDIKQEDIILWPPRGERISQLQYRDLQGYATDNGILLSNFKKADVDVNLIKEVIDDAAKVLGQFPELRGTRRKRFTLHLTTMDSNDFAEVRHRSTHILHLNQDAYRSKESLAREYASLSGEGWFVRGTDYHSIPYHEIGHMFSNMHNIDGFELSKDALGLSKWTDIAELLETTLSQYSVSYDSGIEILPEVFSSYFSATSNKSEIILKLFNKANTIRRG